MLYAAAVVLSTNMKICHSFRLFAKTSFPNLNSYGSTRINLKTLLANIEAHKQNIKNRKADANIEVVGDLYRKYVSAKYEVDSLTMKRREHDE